jgi:drug/metabolite transporter (DMT)-like permease
LWQVLKKELLYIHIAVFIWGFTGILGRTIELTEGNLVWWRVCITVVSLFLLLFTPAYKLFGLSKPVTNINWSGKFKIAIPGFILAVHWLFFYGSIKWANVSLALTCLSTSALIAGIIEPVVNKQRINWSEISLGIMVLLGMLIIYFSHIQFGLGIIFGLLAALFTVLSSLVNKRLVDNHNPSRLTFYQQLGAFLCMSLILPVYNWVFGYSFQFPNALSLLCLFILSWLCTIFTYYLWIAALKKISVFTGNIILALEPIYGIILAFMVYKENEAISKWFYVGFALIIGAVVIHTRKMVKN